MHMFLTHSDYRELAAFVLKGKWKDVTIISLVYYAILLAASFLLYLVNENISSLAAILLMPMTWGLMVMHLDNKRTDEDKVYTFKCSTLFVGFKDYRRITWTMLLVNIYTVLWSLLLIVPGIIKSYQYKLTPFILKDHPEMSANEAIKRSMEVTKGYKWTLFTFDLCYIGWWLLSILSAGIGFLFLIPYYYAALSTMYDDMNCGWERAHGLEVEWDEETPEEENGPQDKENNNVTE